MLNLCASSADQETVEEFLEVPTKFYTGSMLCERTRFQCWWDRLILQEYWQVNLYNASGILTDENIKQRGS